MQPKPNNDIWAPGRFPEPEVTWPFLGPEYVHIEHRMGPNGQNIIIAYTIDLHDPSPVVFTLDEWLDR